MSTLGNRCWLDAHLNRNANLYVLPNGLVLADSTGDGDHRLILIDVKLFEDTGKHSSHLKTYKGSILVADQTLPDVPSGLIRFYTDQNVSRIPAIAVTSGHQLLVYKNSKPYFKLSLPPESLEPLEVDVWRQLQQSNSDPQRIPELLTNLRCSIPLRQLSSRSQRLLQLWSEQSSLADCVEFIGKCQPNPPVKQSPITCVTTLNRYVPSSASDLTAACPLLATESGEIYLLDPKTFSILHQARICAASQTVTPFYLCATGSYDVEYRIVVGCREQCVTLLKRTWLEGQILFQLNVPLVQLLVVPNDEHIIVGTADQFLHCHNRKGLRLWSVNQEASITCLTLIPLHHLSTNLIAVGLRNGVVQLLNGRHLVDTVYVMDAPSAMTFGRLGQEENVLVVVTLSGALLIKILKRTADFNLHSLKKQTVTSGELKPLPLPKKGPLFLEQCEREKDNYQEIHKIFQRDLVQVRLTAARTLVKTLNISTNSNGRVPNQDIRLSAQVIGFGPNFTLILSLENMNSTKALSGFLVIFHANPSMYKFSSNAIPIALIPPLFLHKVQTIVTQTVVEEQWNLTENLLRVFVKKIGVNEVIIGATVSMPSM